MYHGRKEECLKTINGQWKLNGRMEVQSEVYGPADDDLYEIHKVIAAEYICHVPANSYTKVD